MKPENYEQLNTVHLDDLDRLLNSCGINSEYKQKKVKCKFCKNTIDSNNVYSVFKDSGSYKLICDRPECIQSLLQLVNERKKKECGNE